MTQVAERLREIEARLEAACRRAGRARQEISLVAVTKTVPVERIQEAIDAGVRLLGENRVQEAASKFASLRGDFARHMVGHLQRNKVKKAVSVFDMIQSVDSLELAGEIDKRAAEIGKVMPVLVEVNTSGEATKFGSTSEECVDLVAEIGHLKHISVQGLMTIGALTGDQAVVRGCFRRLRDLRGRIQDARIENVLMDYLSMGMTSDFEIAVEEGSNMVRIGTAVFGPRHDPPAA